MARVHIDVTFDHSERSYRAGDFVTGNIELHSARDLQGLDVRAAVLWETHGNGDQDHGPSIALLTESGVGVEGGEVRAIPFGFTCPDGPLSYRGRQVSVGHYVEASVAVPFGRDPRARQEYFVTAAEAAHPAPASTQQVDLPLPVEPFNRDAVRRLLTSPPGVFLWALPLLMMFQFGVFSAVFLGVPAVLMIAAMWLVYRPQLFAHIFHVEATAGETTVQPSQLWPVRLQFDVKHAFSSTGVRARVVGTEIATDTSGQKSATKRHTFHDETVRLEQNRSFAVGDHFDDTFSIAIPDTMAWTFASEHNEVQWAVELVLEIEGFPDWVLRSPLTLAPPRPAIERAPAADALPIAEPVPPVPSPIQDTVIADAPDAPDAPAVTPTPVPAPVPVPAGHAPLAGLLAILADMATGPDRERRVEEAASESFAASIIVDRVVRSMRSSLGDAHRRGREVVGVLSDRDDEVQIFLLESSTDRVAGLGRGDRFECLVTPHAWDGLYKRLVLVEAED